MCMSQNYTPTEWIDNRTVGTASVMNNMEKGIENAHDRIDMLETFMSALCQTLNINYDEIKQKK